jgi:hypothetical protein
MRRTLEKFSIESRGTYIKAVYGAGRGSGTDSVNEDEPIRVFPSVDQSRRVAFVFLGGDTMLAKEARCE